MKPVPKTKKTKKPKKLTLRQQYKQIDTRIDEIDGEIDMLDGVMCSFRNDPASRNKSTDLKWVKVLEGQMLFLESEKSRLTREWDKILDEMQAKGIL